MFWKKIESDESILTDRSALFCSCVNYVLRQFELYRTLFPIPAEIFDVLRRMELNESNLTDHSALFCSCLNHVLRHFEVSELEFIFYSHRCFCSTDKPIGQLVSFYECEGVHLRNFTVVIFFTLLEYPWNQISVLKFKDYLSPKIIYMYTYYVIIVIVVAKIKNIHTTF